MKMTPSIIISPWQFVHCVNLFDQIHSLKIEGFVLCDQRFFSSDKKCFYYHFKGMISSLLSVFSSNNGIKVRE